MQNSQNLESILTTLLTGEEDAVFDALLTLFSNGESISDSALIDCLKAYGEEKIDVFERFAARLGDDVKTTEFLILAAHQMEQSGTSNLSNDLIKAAEIKVQGIGKIAEVERARLLVKLGNEHFRLARYAMAEPLFDAALSIYRRVLGNDHPVTAVSLNILASLYHAQEDFPRAEPLYDAALSIQRRVLGKDHPDTAGSLNNLALLYHNQGDYTRAEPMYEEALSIRRRVLGNDHPETAGSLNNLANLYKTQGDFARAEPIYEQAVEILERTLGAEHPTTKLVRENYEGVLAEMKE